MHPLYSVALSLRLNPIVLSLIDYVPSYSILTTKIVGMRIYLICKRIEAMIRDLLKQMIYIKCLVVLTRLEAKKSLFYCRQVLLLSRRCYDTHASKYKAKFPFPFCTIQLLLDVKKKSKLLI